MSNFSAYRIIDQKKRGIPLTPDEIDWFISGITSGNVADYQASAFLMATYCRGMNTKETAALTKSMLESGHVFKFRSKNIVDKHSTGGIGDKASFVLAPIAAACGVRVPMIAGRGLGHTGGTIDKVESIPGFKTDLTVKKFESLLMKNNIVLMGQTKNIAPADRILYALRDVTATIDSIPLITASIMSKKLAEGANGIVMDIKTGNGAFMEEQKQAEKLGRSIINTAKQFNKKAVALITDMNQPLGDAVGNSLEIIECVETLKGHGPKDLTKLSLELAAYMVLLAGKATTLTLARKKCQAALDSGDAYKIFLKLISQQGGDINTVEDISKLKVAKTKTVIKANKNGFIKSFDTKEIGLKLVDLKGGRKKNSDKIDTSVGFRFHCEISDSVSKGTPLLTIYHHASQASLVKKMEKDFQNSIISITSKKTLRPKLIKKVIR